MSRPKIMIVEDEAIVAYDIAERLKSKNYDVCAMVSSGEEAILKAGETRPDLILMDIVLRGDMDGITASEHITRDYGIPIIYLTAYDDEKTLKRAKLTEPYNFIVKPFGDRELHIAIEIVLYKHAADKKIRKMEHWLATVLESVGDAVIALDHHRRVTFMNQIAEDITGWKENEALGRKVTEVLNIQDLDLDQLEEHLVEKVITEGLIINLLEDNLLVAKDGREVVVSDSAAPLRSNDGEQPGSVIVFRDTTEHKQVQDALKHSERRLSSIFEFLPDPTFVIDNRGVIIAWNKAIETLTGCSAETMLGKGNYEYAIPFYGERRPILVDFLFARDGNASNEYYSMKREGDVIYAETEEIVVVGKPISFWAKASPLRDEEGNIIGAIEIMRDITEHKRMEFQREEMIGALQESEETYRTLVEYLPDIVLRFDRSGRHLFVSENVQDAVDLESSQFIGKTHRELGFPEDICRFCEEGIERVFDTASPVENESAFIGKKGHMVHNWRLVPERDARGVVQSVLSIGRDITAHRSAERDFQMLFREMLDGLALHEIVFDDKGNFVDSIFLAVNPAFERLTGLKALDIQGKSYRDMLPGFSPQLIEACVRVASAADPVIFESEVEELGKHFEVTAFRSSPNKFVCMLHDITEKKQAERDKAVLENQLQQAQKMESIGRLAGGVAHDFNNMLGVIIGHAELALERISSSDQTFDDLQQIRNACDRSADLTRQLLAFARRQIISPTVLDLNETVEGMLKMLRRLIGENIDLAWIPESKLWSIKVDPSQVDQVLANLCVNARDAIEGAGSITIETSNVMVDNDLCSDIVDAMPGEYVMMEVSDDGCGMDGETLSKLFEPFFTTKPVGKGTGLGLATVYGIVKQNNGFIAVHSEPGKGTSFRIYLPRHVGSFEAVQEKTSSSFSARGNETILLVEDEPTVLDVTALMLVRLGYTVLKAATPSEAVKVAHQHVREIGLLMTDVVMPEMNGRSLAETLLSSHPHMKTLFMSGYTADVIGRHGVLDESAHFIQKPFSMKLLSTKVRDVLDKC